MKSGGMRSAENMALMREKRNANRILMGKTKGKLFYFEELVVFSE
jgi:hypothetical protein